MVRFKFIKDKLQITPCIVLFKEFYDIVTWGEKSGKANTLAKYVYHICDLEDDNPTASYPPSERDADAKFRAFHDKNYKFSKKESTLADAAIRKYLEINSTASVRIIERFDTKSNELLSELNSTKPEAYENTKDGITNYVSNASIITKGLTELDDIRKRRLAVIASIKNQAVSTRVRGKLVLSPMSKGMLKVPLDERIAPRT